MAAVLVRPDAAQAAILAALHDAERMLDDLVSRVVPRLPATEENVDRRAVGKLLFLAPNARLLAALGVLDRLPPDPLDGPRINTLWDVTDGLTLAFSSTAPDLLAPAIDDQVDRVTAAQQRSSTSSSRSRLGSLTAETAGLAGWVAYLGGRQGRAQAYFGLARDAARDAGDAARHAFALGSLAATSSVVFGRSSPRTPVAVRLLSRRSASFPSRRRLGRGHGLRDGWPRSALLWATGTSSSVTWIWHAAGSRRRVRPPGVPRSSPRSVYSHCGDLAGWDPSGPRHWVSWPSAIRQSSIRSPIWPNAATAQWRGARSSSTS